MELPEYLVDFRKDICSRCLLGEAAPVVDLPDGWLITPLRQALVLATAPEHRAKVRTAAGQPPAPSVRPVRFPRPPGRDPGPAARRRFLGLVETGQPRPRREKSRGMH